MTGCDQQRFGTVSFAKAHTLFSVILVSLVATYWGCTKLVDSWGPETPVLTEAVLPAQPVPTPVLMGTRVRPPVEPQGDVLAVYLFLRLTDKAVDKDVAILRALLNVKPNAFTHAIVVVPSWQRMPYAFQNPIVRRIISTCRSKGIAVVWGRWLWVAWPSDKLEAPMPNANSHHDASYYATAIATVRAEARFLGAVGSFLDAEPYGDSTQKPTLKFVPIDDVERIMIGLAIKEAVAAAGPVDWIYPTSSASPTHYAWPIARLGRVRCDAKPYYTRESDGQVIANPPAGYQHRLQLWGAFVMPKRTEIRPGLWTLGIGDAKRLDPNVMRQKHEHCKGIWIYPGDQTAEVLAAWN